MSRRTAEAHKAILAAWEREQELVQSGKGTRDWTREQQRDILDKDKGKAYDEHGLAFQGQHMKSAEKYPEYQGDPGNIQFLTRAEHLEAHDGNWRNPTNWYYDPVSKEKREFGDGPFIPCQVIRLFDPIVHIEIEQKPAAETNPCKTTPVKPKAASPPTPAAKPKINLSERLQKAIKNGVKGVVEFPVKHPTASNVIKKAGIGISILVGLTLADKVAKGGSSDSGSGMGDYVDDDKSDSEYSYVDDTAYPSERASPREHIVQGGRQRYHTKEGVVWRDKKPYHRGVSQDE